MKLLKSKLLRMVATPAKEGGSTAPPVQREEASRFGGSTRRQILLVDDDPGIRGSLGDVLLLEGYAVCLAKDGQSALDLAASAAFDLVLLDLNMPRKNGWDTFERLSADHPLVPIVILTARPNQLFMAMNSGAGALMEKPLDIPTLLQVMSRLLTEPAQARLARLAGHKAAFYYASADENMAHSEPRSSSFG